jgi:hypothetical protein
MVIGWPDVCRIAAEAHGGGICCVARYWWPWSICYGSSTKSVRKFLSLTKMPRDQSLPDQVDRARVRTHYLDDCP